MPNGFCKNWLGTSSSSQDGSTSSAEAQRATPSAEAHRAKVEAKPIVTCDMRWVSQGLNPILRATPGLLAGHWVRSEGVDGGRHEPEAGRVV
jgi:hypothetical protein